MTGQEIVDLTKKHTLFEWSAQSKVDPIPGGAGQGNLFLDAGREALHRLQQPVDVGEHWTRRRARHPGDQPSRLRCWPMPIRSWRPNRGRGWERSWRRSLRAILIRFSLRMAARKRTRTPSRLRAFLPGRHKIIARYRSYHGATAGAISLTGDPRRWAVEPGIPGVVRVLDPYHGIERGWESAETSLAMIEETIQLEGPHTIAGFILEPVTGTNGILVPPDGYLEGVRKTVRQVRDSDDCRRSDVGLWAHWRVVCGRSLEGCS
jgi:taurine---2-oxoglutarate transaminase